MNLQSIHNQRKLIFVSAVVGIISIFLPWVTVSIMGMGESINGFRGVGIIVFLAFIVAAIISLSGNQAKPIDKTMWLATLVSGAIALLFTLIAFANKSGDAMGFVEARYGIGIWIALIASLAVLGFTWLLKSPEYNLKDSFEGLKNSTLNVSPSSGSNRISELEKLIELKNQGKISEDEYQQLKSKII